MPECLRGDWTSPEPSMSPQHPPRARGPRGWMAARARIVMNESSAHTRARARRRDASRRPRRAHVFFVSPDRVSARARERSIERARARIRRISTADRSGGRSARRETVSSHDGRARRWNSRAEVFVDRFVDVSRSHRGRARAVVVSIRFDSIDSRPEGFSFHSFRRGSVERRRSRARAESLVDAPHSVPLKDLADRSRGA